jgi:hypothetical protein
MTLTTTFKATAGCRGCIEVHRCELRRGIVEYAVVMRKR